MTALDDRRPVASGLTNMPKPPPELPAVDSARQFYLHGSRAAGTVVWHGHRAAAGLVYYSAPEPDRLARLINWVARELTRMRELQPGWDGHRAVPITEEAVNGTVRALADVLDEDSEPPQFFPLPDGGIQVEWYADDDIEVEIDGKGEAHALVTAANGDIIVEGTFDPHEASDVVVGVARFLKTFSARVAAERQRT
jgi:hypothetical protein